MTKKITVFGLIAITIISISLLLLYLSKPDSQEIDKVDLTNYYNNLYNGCSERYPEDEILESCCFLSVDVMSYDNYLLANDNNSCPENYEPKNINCQGSYTWCVQIPATEPTKK